MGKFISLTHHTKDVTIIWKENDMKYEKTLYQSKDKNAM